MGISLITKWLIEVVTTYQKERQMDNSNFFNLRRNGTGCEEIKKGGRLGIRTPDLLRVKQPL